MERPRSESVGLIGCFGERFAAIAERDGFFGQRAGSIGADRLANAADSAARTGSSDYDHEQCCERNGFEFEQRCKQPTCQNAATVERATSEFRFEYAASEYNAVAAPIPDLQRQHSATALGGHGLDQFRAFERHF